MCVASIHSPKYDGRGHVLWEVMVPMHSVAEKRALVVVAAMACAGTSAAGQDTPAACRTAAGETRWLAESYRETHTYGLGEDEWIASYGGLVASGDTLFLYDQLRPRIVHLSGELEERDAFGRQGEGPGELNHAIPIVWLNDSAEDHVAFDGRQLVVWDRNDVASFDPGGEFHWSAMVPVRRILGRLQGVRFVSPMYEEEMIFAVDSIDAEGRRLQLWRVQRPDPNRRELLWEKPVFERVLDDVPRTFGGREARSYWARHQDCLIVIDGGNPYLWTLDLATLQADSIALPEWEVPEFGELRSDHSAINLGGREIDPPLEPGLLWRWRGLIVDPGRPRLAAGVDGVPRGV